MNSKGYIPVTHGTLYYEEQGSGGIPCVFLHGFTFSSAMWRDVIQALPQEFRVVSYDARGFGKSSLPSHPYSHVEDYKKLLESRTIKRHILVGFSMGGTIALDYVLQNPKDVHALILISPAIGGYPNTVNWKVYTKGDSTNDTLSKWYNHEVFAYTRKHKNTAQKLQQYIHQYSGWHFLNKDPKIKPDSVANMQLEKIQSPTRVLIGRHDLEYFHQMAVELENRLPTCTRVVLKHAGHMSPIEQPEKIATQIVKVRDKVRMRP